MVILKDGTVFKTHNPDEHTEVYRDKLKENNMKQPLIAVYDKKTSLYENPFVVRHNGEAIREWDHVRKDPNTKFGKNPEDFDLFQIGTYDSELGRIENNNPPTHLGTLS